MANMRDLLSRAEAAGGMMRGGGGEMPPPEAELPPEEEEMAPPQPGQDLDGALIQVEAALETLDPKKAEEARTHLNAIREIASGAGGGEEEEPLPDELGASEIPPPEPPADDLQSPT